MDPNTNVFTGPIQPSDCIASNDGYTTPVDAGTSKTEPPQDLNERRKAAVKEHLHKVRALKRAEDAKAKDEAALERKALKEIEDKAKNESLTRRMVRAYVQDPSGVALLFTKDQKVQMLLNIIGTFQLFNIGACMDAAGKPAFVMNWITAMQQDPPQLEVVHDKTKMIEYSDMVTVMNTLTDMFTHTPDTEKALRFWPKVVKSPLFPYLVSAAPMELLETAFEKFTPTQVQQIQAMYGTAKPTAEGVAASGPVLPARDAQKQVSNANKKKREENAAAKEEKELMRKKQKQVSSSSSSSSSASSSRAGSPAPASGGAAPGAGKSLGGLRAHGSGNK
jgi:hypothetical protein